MAGPLPNVPTNFMVQPGNGTVYLSWNPSVGGSSGVTYNILRSTDNVTFLTIASSATASTYYDTSATTGILYYYQVQSANPNGQSVATASLVVTPVNRGQVSLGQLRLAAQQRADMVNNNFVTPQEWNDYINKSFAELYDIIVQVYGDDYYVADPFQFTADGRTSGLYPLPTNIYKLLGVDLGVSANNNAWVTLRKFSFISRNQYIYGNTTTNPLGRLNIQYREVGNNIEFVSQPANNQQIRLWFIPRPQTLLADNDVIDAISGWEEYIIVDAAIKALQKEESDVTILMAQKEALKHRIEAAASNRDAGEPECATDVRRLNGSWSDGPWGGY